MPTQFYQQILFILNNNMHVGGISYDFAVSFMYYQNEGFMETEVCQDNGFNYVFMTESKK
jgi:hypothetical protein